VKNQKVNERLYNIHLKCANQWQGLWNWMQTALNQKLNE
jgi:hypothetical protein